LLNTNTKCLKKKTKWGWVEEVKTAFLEVEKKKPGFWSFVQVFDIEDVDCFFMRAGKSKKKKRFSRNFPFFSFKQKISNKDIKNIVQARKQQGRTIPATCFTRDIYQEVEEGDRSETEGDQEYENDGDNDREPIEEKMEEKEKGVKKIKTDPVVLLPFYMNNKKNESKNKPFLQPLTQSSLLLQNTCLVPKLKYEKKVNSSSEIQKKENLNFEEAHYQEPPEKQPSVTKKISSGKKSRIFLFSIFFFKRYIKLE
jgi:hypothetical protein